MKYCISWNLITLRFSVSFIWNSFIKYIILWWIHGSQNKTKSKKINTLSSQSKALPRFPHSLPQSIFHFQFRLQEAASFLTQDRTFLLHTWSCTLQNCFGDSYMRKSRWWPDQKDIFVSQHTPSQSSKDTGDIFKTVASCMKVHWINFKDIS